MDISNIGTKYTELYSNSAQLSKLETTVKSDPSAMKDEELMDACKQFEAYFLEQVFKEMQKTVHRNEDSSQNSLMEYFEDQYVQKIAEDSTEQNSLGLAQMHYEQMRRNYGMDSMTVEKLPAENGLVDQTEAGNGLVDQTEAVDGSEEEI